MAKQSKREETRQKRKAKKSAQYRRTGGQSRFARKKAWRKNALNGAPIPTSYGSMCFEDAREAYNRGVNVSEET